MKIQNEINERIKKASQFYHLVKGLIINKDIDEKFKFNILKIDFKRILIFGAETMQQKPGQSQKERIAKFKP